MQASQPIHSEETSHQNITTSQAPFAAAAAASQPPPTTPTKYPFGVVQAGIILDMTEYLSFHPRPTDLPLSLWLSDHFIRPFGHISRLDGLVVRSRPELSILVLAHARYAQIFPMPLPSLAPQPLWVPGLEPAVEPAPVDHPKVPLRRLVRAAPFEPAVGNCRRVGRRGECVGVVVDGRGWEREVWRAEVLGEGEGGNVSWPVGKVLVLGSSVGSSSSSEGEDRVALEEGDFVDDDDDDDDDGGGGGGAFDDSPDSGSDWCPSSASDSEQ
ncbi:hypothetical protein BS50DRAFT_665207 [Corynespora cassiicola Philippines]|uniref:Uncharacterized protein n=1 Tax=Corynespora cassiicola Philippines TaxID=1448308 RepID=A0A2T2NQT1_CORCC|nr:hypothetical protein BS50DRAFT_665207 [Corynespora cassiicola Philippines]